VGKLASESKILCF